LQNSCCPSLSEDNGKFSKGMPSSSTTKPGTQQKHDQCRRSILTTFTTTSSTPLIGGSGGYNNGLQALLCNLDALCQKGRLPKRQAVVIFPEVNYELSLVMENVERESWR
jgi:hypothetical protein